MAIELMQFAKLLLILYVRKIAKF